MPMHLFLRLPIVINMLGLMLGSIGLIISTNNQEIILIGHTSLFLFTAIWAVYIILFIRDRINMTCKYRLKWLTPKIF